MLKYYIYYIYIIYIYTSIPSYIYAISLPVAPKQIYSLYNAKQPTDVIRRYK